MEYYGFVCRLFVYENYVWNTMGLYGDYLSMKTMYGMLWSLYGSVCMDISGSIPRVY